MRGDRSRWAGPGGQVLEARARTLQVPSPRACGLLLWQSSPRWMGCEGAFSPPPPSSTAHRW